MSEKKHREIKSFCCGMTRFKVEEAINSRPIDVVSIVSDGSVYIVFYYDKLTEQNNVCTI